MIDSSDFESRLRAFEQAWLKSPPPEIGDFLPPSLASAERPRLLQELIAIDLEYRWKLAQRGETPAWRLDEYVRRLSELGAFGELSLELIVEEYRARHRWGDRPNHLEYIERFGSRSGQLLDALRQADQELRDESDTEPAMAAPPPRIGTRDDPRAPLAYADYRLQRLIGAGRVGKVYLARQQSLDRAVAVKYLRKVFQQQPQVVEAFLEEARTLARLRHPGVVDVHGLGRTPGGGFFIAMELVEGPDLARVMQRGPVTIADAVRWARAACPAIDHAHERGIVHCDLKPANLLLDADGRIRVTDFGLARSLHRESLFGAGIAGTAPFMAPEQVADYWGMIDPRTDVYGLGAVLYTLLTGQPPWRETRLPDVLAKVVSAVKVDDPRSLRPEIPEMLSEICLRCLAKNPADRYSSALELEAALGLPEVSGTWATR